MNGLDRKFISRYGEGAWCILRAYKTKGHIVIEKQEDVLAILQKRQKKFTTRKCLRYWLNLLQF